MIKKKNLPLRRSLDALLASYATTGKIPGVAARIMCGEEILYEKAAGTANTLTEEPLALNSIYRLFSLSKPITVTAVLRLWAEGKLSLDDLVEKYIPAFADPRVLLRLDGEKPVTEAALRSPDIRDLLTMTSGMSYGFRPDIFEIDSLYSIYWDMRLGRIRISLEEVADRLGKLPLAFSPGSDFRYSVSHDILGRIVEIVSGQSFGEYLHENIFTPLGMTDTGFTLNAEQTKRLTALYRMRKGEAPEIEDAAGVLSLRREPAFDSGGGGLFSTLEDYSRFCGMLACGGAFQGKRILGEETIAEMATNRLKGEALKQFQRRKQGYGYGLGVRVLISPAKAQLLCPPGEFGWDGMATLWMGVHPKSKISMVLMMQMLPYGFYPIIREFQKCVYAAIFDS